MKIRSVISAAVLALSSLALIAPAAQAGGSVCYSAQVTVNGADQVNEAGCHELP